MKWAILPTLGAVNLGASLMAEPGILQHFFGFVAGLCFLATLIDLARPEP